MKKLKAKELRKKKADAILFNKIKRIPIYFILDEVLDTYNIGSLFRLADAVAVKKVYLCGKMNFPPSSRIHKAAVGTENWVPWEKRDSTIKTVRELQKKGVQIIAVEQHKNSLPYSSLLDYLKLPCAIVVGNETYGVNKDVLKKADLIVELPMLGINHSFNVWGSAAVVVYKILEKIISPKQP